LDNLVLSKKVEGWYKKPRQKYAHFFASKDKSLGYHAGCGHWFDICGHTNMDERNVLVKNPRPEECCPGCLRRVIRGENKNLR
jgi:hypothetical protein